MIKKAVLIDGSNLFHSLKRIGKKIDYSSFKEFLLGGEQSHSIVYYGSRPAKTPKNQLQFLFNL